MKSQSAQAWKTPLLLAVLVIIWGVSWPIYKIALQYTPPILFAGMRSLLGGIILVFFLLPTWKKLNFRANWSRYLLSAILNITCFFGFQTVGLLYLPGGLFSVLVYFQPVLIGLFSWLWLGENMNPLKIAGLLIGFLGIVVISAQSFTGDVSVLGVVLALLTVLAWALGVIYIKKQSTRVDSMWMVAMQCILGGAILTVVGARTESFGDIVWSGSYLGGLAFGTVLGVPLAFSIYYKLVNGGDASKVASFTFLVPLIAVLCGTVFLREPLTYSLLAGLVLIVLSISFVNYKGGKSKKPALTQNL
ncbi:DMT family transporter [Tumebacillus flagellatus]|uniref:Membrane protein n=1 Tax=Tumebacillus flagellatus TaxID=1157490 RepID=A0A074LM43_9BACL|nr:DMT family transporter [Tumebacillus flagellatus]KEO83156.1 membrane protein [Tumebacillus flagellatus]